MLVALAVSKTRKSSVEGEPYIYKILRLTHSTIIPDPCRVEDESWARVARCFLCVGAWRTHGAMVNTGRAKSHEKPPSALFCCFWGRAGFLDVELVCGPNLRTQAPQGSMCTEALRHVSFNGLLVGLVSSVALAFAVDACQGDRGRDSVIAKPRSFFLS